LAADSGVRHWLPGSTTVSVPSVSGRPAVKVTTR
jgi:hypothetical protein